MDLIRDIDAACVVCGNPRRIPNRPPVCDGCRARLVSQLRELPELYALLPAVLARPGGSAEKVSGTREAPVPLSLDVVDLLAESRRPNPTAEARSHPDDAVGGLSVASALDEWVRDWRAARSKGEGLPVPTVAALSGWLRVRLDWACDQHPAIGEFATEIRHIAASLRTTLALRRHVDRLEAPCPTCDMRALYREVDPVRGAADYIRCGGCGRLWTPDEYARLAVILVHEDLRAA